MLDFIREHEAWLWWLAGLSVVTFVVTLIAVPILVARIPADYFQRERTDRRRVKAQHPVVWLAAMIAKNLLGVIFLAVGFALLFLPGQGIITMVIGLTLMNFPGKRRLERWIVSRQPVHRAINWLRRRWHQPPLQL